MKTIIHVSEIRTEQETVFDALTSIDGLASWWTTEVNGDPGDGGVIDFKFGGDFNPSMQVMAFEPPSGVSWKCVRGVDQWAENTFRFELERQGNDTHLRFRQEYANELSDDDYGTYNYNWGYYLDSLRLYVETGTGKPFGAAPSPS